MKSWLQHTGYPVVVVDDMKIASNGEVTLHVHQERFMISGAPPSVQPPIWTYVTAITITITITITNTRFSCQLK
jgi:aminopeptidase N